MNRWYEQAGPKSDVVISSRVRLARNIAGYAFPSTAEQQTLEAVLSLCKEKISKVANGYQLHWMDLRQLTPLTRCCYIEQHLLSPDLALGNTPSGLILNEAETGIGTILATSYLQLDWDVISTILTDVYQGIRAKYAPEETE